MEYRHLGQTIQKQVADHPENTALRYKKDGQWQTLTYAGFGKKINALAAALVRAGVQKGDNVGIYSANRYEWAITDFACIMAGAVSVPIYATNTRDQAKFIINDAGIKLIFTGDAAQFKNVQQISESGYDLTIVSYDSNVQLSSEATMLFEKFIQTPPGDTEKEKLQNRQSELQPSDTTTIIYTSGTTGDPKGVMITHVNLFHQMEAIDANFIVTPEDTSLCFLPLSHVFERMWSYYIYYKGAGHSYLNDPKQVIETLQEVRPTAMVSVPRLYEKIYANVKNTIETAPVVKKILFRRAQKAGWDYHLKKRANAHIPLGLKIRHAFYDKLILSKIREVVGGDKNFFAAGGAPLDKAIEEFFFSCGLLICQGYGLTETSPMISCNTPGAFKFGTVGKPVPGCTVRIAENGEVQVKGPQVMKGYYNNPEKTDQEIQNGWFKTGDVGEIDADGFLKITDRIKDLIITSGGKNIAPQRIETLVGKDFFIEQIVTIGDKRKYITALIVPFFEGLETWAEKKGIPFSSARELVQHPEVIAFYQKRIDYHSKTLAGFESIKKFTLIPAPFTVETGEITPTLKPKRKFINEKYRDQINAMY